MLFDNNQKNTPTVATQSESAQQQQQQRGRPTRGRSARGSPPALTIYDDHPAFEAAPLHKALCDFVRERWGSAKCILKLPRATAPKPTTVGAMMGEAAAATAASAGAVQPSSSSSFASPSSSANGGDGGGGSTTTSVSRHVEPDPAFVAAAAGLFTGFDLADGVATVLGRPTLLHEAARTGCKFTTAAAAAAPTAKGYAIRRDQVGGALVCLSIAPEMTLRCSRRVEANGRDELFF